MATVNQLLAKAAGELGYSRWNDPESGTKYGRWYEAVIDKRSDNYNFGSNGVPYCAMFVSWCLTQVGASCTGFATAYCPSGVAAARGKGKLRSASTAKPGDVVYFDWEGDGISDHVGFVERNNGTYLQTIEGNTNNGAVARRTRAYSTVIGVVTPDYDGVVSKPTPAPQVTQQAVAAAKPSLLSIDGLWGSDTTRALQKALGTYVDGIVSDQDARYRSKNPGLTVGWEWHTNAKQGSNMIRAMQKKIGANSDGIAGNETFRKLQKYLGTYQDGRIDKPSNCVIALQKRLNTGRF